MAEIAGGDAVAEFQGRDADQKIGDWKAHAFGLILTVDLPNAKSDHHRDRMNGQVCRHGPHRGPVRSV